MNPEFSWLMGLHISTGQIPPLIAWIANILFLLIMIWAATRVPYVRFIRNVSGQHVYFGAMVMLLLLWGLKAGVSPGLGHHHLGATLFTLMFDWPLALFGLTIIMVASLLMQHNEIISIGVNACLSIVIPVWVSYATLKLSQRYLPDNFFIYIFVVAFFGAGLAVAATRIASIVFLALVNAYPEVKLIDESLILTPLFMFPEMFVTGMLISIFVVYKPDWVVTFEDERYLKGK